MQMSGVNIHFGCVYVSGAEMFERDAGLAAKFAHAFCGISRGFPKSTCCTLKSVLVKTPTSKRPLQSRLTSDYGADSSPRPNGIAPCG